jgi:5-methyltetrahydropteroyltriglutamate--homocysteine methyltransferase
VDSHTYPDMAGFFGELGAAYNAAMRDFAAAGCRYLQLDETNIAYLCDPEQLRQLQNRGEQVAGLLETYAKLINAAIAGRPADMVVSMHLCRGNFRSMHIASGGYDPVAEVLFNAINVNAYFMEYDDERSGSFAALRFLPKGMTVVLCLVTSKSGAL